MIITGREEEEIAMCNACFEENKINSFTIFTVECKDSTIVIRNVPCLECRICGELTFTDDVSARLERIVNKAKNSNISLETFYYDK